MKKAPRTTPLLSALRDVQDKLDSLRPAASHNTLTGRTSRGVTRSSLRIGEVRPQIFPREVEAVALLPLSNQMIAEGQGVFYLVDLPQEFGRTPREDYLEGKPAALPFPKSNFLWPLPGRERPDVGPAGLQTTPTSSTTAAQNIEIERYGFQVRRLMLPWDNSVPLAEESALNTNRTVTQFWWPTYTSASRIRIMPSGPSSTLNPLQSLQAVPDNITFQMMAAVTGGQSLLTGWFDLNVDARRWTNYRDIVSRAIIPIPPFKETFTDSAGETVEIEVPSRETTEFDQLPDSYYADFYQDHL